MSDDAIPLPEGEDPEAWARLLRANWERRSRTDKRDFYVASHRGWQDPGRWEAQAEIDVHTMFYGVDAELARGWDVLEIGCGVGRLAGPLTARASSYTGFDVAAGMVEEARTRSASLERARFFVGDGLHVPAEARDREYDLALAVAVFIHCPRSVIASNVASALETLRPGGQLRLQVLADPEDPEGISSLEAAASDHAEMLAVEAEHDDEETQDLIEGHYYMGDRFRYAELDPFLRAAGADDVLVFRPTLQHMYAIVTKAGGAADEG